MSKKYDLIGKRFGKLVVQEKLESIKYKSGRTATQWKCLCDCGNYINAITANLNSGKTQQCVECADEQTGLKHRKDITGQKFGKLTVKKMLYNYNGTNITKCLCDCDCGNTDVLKNPFDITSGIIQSCGCIKGLSQRQNIVGNKYGRLTVLEELFMPDGNHKVRCICDCGNEGIFGRRDVMSEHTTSCGCRAKELLASVNKVDQAGIITDFGIEIIDEYGKNKNGQMLWNCKCGICGKIFQELPARVKNGHVKSCGCLKSSFGEKFIENVLNEYKLSFIPQYSFEDCKSDNGYKLRFDFAVFDNNQILLFLIEYDGEQHFYPIDYFGGEDLFKDTLRRDDIKNTYCKNNNILLLRIPYTFTNKQIEESINNTLESVTTTGVA